MTTVQKDQPFGFAVRERSHLPPCKSLFGVDLSIVDYDSASDLIIAQALAHQSYGVTSLAVHGLVTAIIDKKIGEHIAKLDMVTPDGQPIRWALNSFYNLGIKDRVYGPTLTLQVLEKAGRNNLKVFLYGSTTKTLDKLSEFIRRKYPTVAICGVHKDRFRDATVEEDSEDIEKINASGAHIVLVGRGCPRQEAWVSDHLGKINAVMMAVGATFDFHAGTVKQAPPWMQDRGLEWFFRFLQEPGRLWKRYLITNTYFILLFLKYKFILRRPF